MAFDRPGLGKIACNFSLRSYGTGRTLVSYETRTKGTDKAARRGFMRYWRPVSPFIGIVMRSQLHVIDDQAATVRHRTEPQSATSVADASSGPDTNEALRATSTGCGLPEPEP